MLVIHNKLVRDNIPELIKAEGNGCIYKVAPDKDMPTLLLTKLHEELAELVEACNLKDIPKILEELSDMTEVINELVNRTGSTIDYYIIMADKSEKSGGFKKNIVLEAVDYDIDTGKCNE